MTKRFYLLKFSRDWADEFQAEGLAVISGEHFDALDTLCNSEEIADEHVWFYFGTNEGWEDEFTYSELWNNEISKVEISSLQADFLSEHVLAGGSTFGQFPDFEYLFENFEGVEAVDKYYEGIEARLY